MTKIAMVLVLVSAGAAFAQSGCPGCEQASKLRDALRKVEIGNAAQKAQGEALGKESLALVTAFRDSPPPHRQGRKTFESLVALGLYAAPFGSGDYENALAAIGAKDPAYRKRYQAMVRKGVRGRDRAVSCRMRYLQTNVSVAECKLQEANKGASAEIAGRLCDTSYDLGACLAKKK